MQKKENFLLFSVVEKFVEFFGPGVSSLSVADRATVSNMAPEYGATVGFFPMDKNSMTYLRLTGMRFTSTSAKLIFQFVLFL